MLSAWIDPMQLQMLLAGSVFIQSCISEHLTCSEDHTVLCDYGSADGGVSLSLMKKIIGYKMLLHIQLEIVLYPTYHENDYIMPLLKNVAVK